MITAGECRHHLSHIAYSFSVPQIQSDVVAKTPQRLRRVRWLCKRRDVQGGAMGGGQSEMGDGDDRRTLLQACSRLTRPLATRIPHSETFSSMS